MSTMIEGNKAIYVATAVQIIDDTTECAWAEKYVITNPSYKWILGRYAEADQPNSNRQFFAMSNLKFGQATLAHSPLNINHEFLPVGTFVASEIVYPTGEGVDDEGLNPYLEALSVFWKDLYPDEYRVVESAYKAGNLFYSMEALPERVTCSGEAGCGQEFAYVGRTDDTYCRHLNDPNSGVIKDFANPLFKGGALIVPPVRPGWGRADIKELSRYIEAHAEAAERIYEEALPQSEAEMWEAVMAAIMEMDV